MEEDLLDKKYLTLLMKKNQVEQLVLLKYFFNFLKEILGFSKND